MAKKTHSLAVKVGKYVKNGEEKNKYIYIGSVIEGEYGPFILMDKTFNPAGVPCGGDCIKVSMFNSSLESATPAHIEEEADVMPF